MRPFYTPFLLLIIIGCSTNKTSEQTQPDTLRNSNDALPNQEAAKEVVRINPTEAVALQLPDYKESAITEDSVEILISEKLNELIQLYQNEKYVAINSNYSVHYPIGNDFDDSTTDGEETGRQNWFYNIDGELRAYATEKENKDAGEIYRQSKLIYLFEDGKLAGAYSYTMSNGQIGFENTTRIITSGCPDCGVSIDQEGTEPTVSQVNQSIVSDLEDEFFNEYNELRSWFRKMDFIPATTKDGRRINRTKYFNDSPYTVTYTVQSSLFKWLTMSTTN